MARTHVVLKSSPPNPIKATNAMEKYERENKKKINKELQDLDLIGSPHIEEEILVGGNIDLDLLFCFSQKDSRSMGGMGRKGRLFKVNNGGERKWKSQRPNEEGASP
jgi:hypothetical protein